MRLILTQPYLSARGSEENCQKIEALIGSVKNEILPDDILLLPEHFTFNNDPGVFDDFVKELAQNVGCIVIGGSHHRKFSGKQINYGLISDGKGRIMGEYTKLRPYFNEKELVSPGDRIGEFVINGKNILILICADFWYSDILLKLKNQPDLILVPALSVSRKSGPEYSRSLWKHFAIQRAYEYGVFVGISDWNDGLFTTGYRTCGVGGFADPTQIDPEKLFKQISDKNISFFDLDFDELEKFRTDRKMRGFFWK